GGPEMFSARVASAGDGGTIELRLDSPNGTLIGTCTIAGTGGAQTWTTVSCPVTEAEAVKDLYLVFTGGAGDALFNVNWWQFSRQLVIATQPRSLTVAPGGRLSL